MPRKRTIAPRACKQLNEGATPAADRTPAPFLLPSSFPGEHLDPDQIELVQDWYTDWIGNILHTLRSALLGTVARPDKHCATPPADLQHLLIHAAVLSHLLHLHPAAAELSLPALAKALRCPVRKLYYARDAILDNLGAHVAAAFRRTTRTTADAVAHIAHIAPELDLAAATWAGHRTIVAPFKRHTILARRFAICQRIAASPAVAAVSEDLDPETSDNTIRITLKP